MPAEVKASAIIVSPVKVIKEGGGYSEGLHK